ncbi:exopolysaccharide biosynthesis protein [Halomonas sp. MCCC 1A11036]|uniref:Exopolysaccharide biosynthesis protein n=1 Tax=Billgrantia zhangzhouensis TaxID=2733481 RepID=A0ABS9ADZ7_9GAMM|nr:exopolysaccharide biosynthesis protein [Halomonas zhangzhouensis]MCE8019940.1 exopolysaccharide biosynthesis protein [Halomonas zhangzhouensis]
MQASRDNQADDSNTEPHNLVELMHAIESINTPSGRIRFDEVLDAIGRRAFGPLLLLAGLVTLMPIVSGIPGVPTLMALFTLLVCVQLLVGRRTFWLPGWLRNRTLPSDKVHTGLKWMYKPAKWVDRLLHPRITFMTGRQGVRLTALACFTLALAMPPMELVPLTVNIAGVALTLFGLAIMARDGLLSILAFLLTGLSLFVILYNLL